MGLWSTNRVGSLCPRQVSRKALRALKEGGASGVQGEDSREKVGRAQLARECSLSWGRPLLFLAEEPGKSLIDAGRPEDKDELEGVYRDATFTLLLSGTAMHSTTTTKCRPRALAARVEDMARPT